MAAAFILILMELIPLAVWLEMLRDEGPSSFIGRTSRKRHQREQMLWTEKLISSNELGDPNREKIRFGRKLQATLRLEK